MNSIHEKYTIGKFSIPSKFTVKRVFVFTAFCPFAKNTCLRKFLLAIREKYRQVKNNRFTVLEFFFFFVKVDQFKRYFVCYLAVV